MLSIRWKDFVSIMVDKKKCLFLYIFLFFPAICNSDDSKMDEWLAERKERLAREQAVYKITDQNRLAKIAVEDKYENVRKADVAR